MLIFVSKMQGFIGSSIGFYLTGGILFNYFSGLLFNYIIHDKMEVLLSATKGLSMAMFVSNVLLHHFEEYKEDINAVKAKYIEKLSKKM